MITITDTIKLLSDDGILIDETKCQHDGTTLKLEVLQPVPFSVLDKLTDYYSRVTLGNGVLILKV